MVVDLKITNAKVFYRGELIDAGLCIDNGKISAIGKDSILPNADELVDAKEMICLPGMVDIHTHLRDLDLAYKEDFVSGTSAAAAGGFTTIVDMPNTKPTTDSLPRLEEKIRIASSKILTNLGFNLVPSGVDQMSKTKDLALGFKFNLVKQWSELVINEENLTSIIRTSNSLGKTVVFHAEDGETVDGLEERLRNDKGPEAYYKAHPPEAELISVKKILKCADGTRSRIHFCHVSTLEGLSAIREARAAGMFVTCEVTPHHTLLDMDSVIAKGGVSIMDPPLRARSVMEALFEALRAGSIDILASDHAPHSLSEKNNPNWWMIPIGIPGLETTLPLYLTEVKKGRISLERLVQVLSRDPPKVLGIGQGGIEEGAKADLVIVDFKREAKIDSSKFFSKAKYSPFDGAKVTGWPVKTFLSGQLVYDQGQIISKPGSGHILTPKSASA